MRYVNIFKNYTVFFFALVFLITSKHQSIKEMRQITNLQNVWPETVWSPIVKKILSWWSNSFIPALFPFPENLTTDINELKGLDEAIANPETQRNSSDLFQGFNLIQVRDFCLFCRPMSDNFLAIPLRVKKMVTQSHQIIKSLNPEFCKRLFQSFQRKPQTQFTN